MKELLYSLTIFAVIALIYLGFGAHVTFTKWIIKNTVKQECLKVEE